MSESEPTAVYAPIRIMGIQKRCTLADAHQTLGELWQRWEGGDKASRLPSFTMTDYCVYQYADDAPNEVLITIGRIVAQDFPLPAFAAETTIPVEHYRRFTVPEPNAQSVYQTWAEVEQDDTLPRTFTTDFETYRLDTLPRIYVGVQPPVETE